MIQFNQRSSSYGKERSRWQILQRGFLGILKLRDRDYDAISHSHQRLALMRQKNSVRIDQAEGGIR